MKFIKIMLIIVLLFNTGLIKVQAQTVTDIDGNVYNTVTIGTQKWMKENLKTTKYNDGTAIPLVTDGTAWGALSTPGFAWYNNDEANYKSTYGALYNWYAVDAAINGGKNICLTGWHVPTEAQWTTLTAYLGGGDVAGGKLKETGTTHWLNPNRGATNESGFTALPGGVVDIQGNSFNLGSDGYWWSTTDYDATGFPYFLNLVYRDGKIYISNDHKRNGFSVRCLSDIATDITYPSTSAIEIYPNPVSGILTIDYKNENFETIKILNSQGLLMTKVTTIIPGQQLDFSKYASGLYILEFTKTSGEVRRIKVVKR
jgi:uncharacterized protein (TIGR02145 family)